MNAWDVDPNLQLSTYAAIGHGIILLFNSLNKPIGEVISLGGRQLKVKNQQALEYRTRDEMHYCCKTPFNELAENHRLYYPIPHVF